MLTFNPGPSQLSEETKKNILRASEEGILSISHRSAQFSAISQNAILGLREFFNIPEDYKVFYTASATEAMQLSILNACERQSFHFVNGSFSESFFKIGKLYNKNPSKEESPWGETPDYSVKILENIDFISITHNETSTGAWCGMEDIKIVKKNNPEKILAIDITSSAGAAEAEINQADIWLFSVQKCFGLPAGLGILIISPRAYEKSLKQINNFSGLYSFGAMWEKMAEKYQTVSTPNVLDIFLLGEELKTWNTSGGLAAKIAERKVKYKILENLILGNKNLDFFVKQEKSRSETVLCAEAEEIIIQEIHARAKAQNIILGSGYGKIKPTTFRIANFPAIKEGDLKKLENIINC